MIRSFQGHRPKVDAGAFVHDSAEIIGRVFIGRGSSIWPLSVLRADVNRIVIGDRTNIQDLCVIHCREKFPAVIGRSVTVGHRVIIHGARIGDGCLIGMGAVVMEAVVGARSLVAAGSLVLAGMRIPPESLVRGSPARVVRKLTKREMQDIKQGERSYLELARIHRDSSHLIFA